MIYDYIYKGSVTAIVLMGVIVGIHSIPFSWFVDIKSINYLDTCVGSDIITIESERYPRWNIKAHAYEQLIYIDGSLIRETSIDRVANFGYEVDSGFATFDTRWSGTIDKPGTYGINSWVEIYPIPGVTIKKFTSYKDARFNVVNCDV